jgi:hypothetical protein
VKRGWREGRGREGGETDKRGREREKERKKEGKSEFSYASIKIRTFSDCSKQ